MQLKQASTFVQLFRRHEHLADKGKAGGRGAGQHLFTVSVKTRIIQMSVAFHTDRRESERGRVKQGQRLF
jgi:hypothetical protein